MELYGKAENKNWVCVYVHLEVRVSEACILQTSDGIFVCWSESFRH